ncbi:MAG: putative MFS-type transporter YhjX [Gammaproteobacteria bacterium]|nr:MAG: putative MFS-type transporter YhjX [Gammaproteobacteria bacterium]
MSVFSKVTITANNDFNRWYVPPISISIHLCIGSVYAWSMFNPALTTSLGVVTSSANDWSLSDVVWIFSTAIVFLGLAAAFAGKWLEEVGPRLVGFVSACLWGGGFLVGSLGIFYHQLFLVYLGYGVMGGCGLGLGYVSPVSTLIRWFPDRRGMATGMAIMGFGGGAMIGAPLISYLLDLFHVAPVYLGSLNEVILKTIDGVRYADINNVLTEVVVLAASEAIESNYNAGVYVVGTGDTGAGMTFVTLGISYFIIMSLASFGYRIPPENWKPKNWDESKRRVNSSPVTNANVHIDEALKTPQFYFLWIVLCFNVTAGIGVLGVAKTMMSEIFSSALPSIVNASFAATYVLMISAFNMVGRFFWASTSDYIGRKNTYYIFFILGILLYTSIPFTASAMSINPSIVLLIYFYAATMIIFTMYGGGFATIPAYLADIFGTKYVGGIHGRLLTAWSTAGVIGPLAITTLRSSSIDSAILDLSQKVDPLKFQNFFGDSIENISQLIITKTVTIPKLMSLAPEGTIDPTSTVYNSTMFLMAFLLAIALLANYLIKPVDPKHHM